MRNMHVLMALAVPLFVGCTSTADDTSKVDSGHSGDSGTDDSGDSGGDSGTDTGDTGDTDDTGDDAADAAAQELFYATDTVQIIQLRMSQEEIDLLTEDPEEYVTAGFEWSDQVLGAAGIKIRGGQSWDEKPGFTIDFEKFDGPEFINLNRVVLDNQYDDTAMVRAVLAYEAYRAGGLPAPRANFAEVYLNDDYLGVYSNIEDVDSKFAWRVYADSTGAFYEGDDGSDFYEQGVQFFDLLSGEDDETALRGAWEAVQPPYDVGFYEDASTALDMAQYTSYVAWLQAVGSNEGYPYEQNDFYIYEDPTTERFSFVPWALDQSWTSGWTAEANRGFLAVYCDLDDTCLAAQRAASIAALDSVEAMALSARAQELYDLTEDSVARDDNKQLPTDQIVAGRASFKTTLAGWPARVRTALGI